MAEPFCLFCDGEEDHEPFCEVLLMERDMAAENSKVQRTGFARCPHCGERIEIVLEEPND